MSIEINKFGPFAETGSGESSDFPPVHLIACQTVNGSAKRPNPSKCELRPGIGLCDECDEPKCPQTYVGYGIMLCADCLAKSISVKPTKQRKIHAIHKRSRGKSRRHCN
jgi:hypothetical protein